MQLVPSFLHANVAASLSVAAVRGMNKGLRGMYRTATLTKNTRSRITPIFVPANIYSLVRIKVEVNESKGAVNKDCTAYLEAERNPAALPIVNPHHSSTLALLYTRCNNSKHGSGFVD